MSYLCLSVILLAQLLSPFFTPGTALAGGAKKPEFLPKLEEMDVQNGRAEIVT